MPRTLLAVHAHPDDESSKGAGTFARYADEGVRTVIVTCTGGEAGDILNPAMDQPGNLQRMPELRRQELAKALEILQVSQHHFLGYRDSGMPDTETNHHPEAFAKADLDEAVGRLVRIFRQERPQVVLTYDERGGYPHPDHIRTHEVSVAAFAAAGDAGRYPEAGEPFQPAKLYYFATFSRHRMRRLHEGLLERGIQSPYEQWLRSWEEEDAEQGREPWPEPEITTQVDVGKWLPQARDALLAHATQIDPNGVWFAVADDVVADLYPWEDYKLVRALVETDLPETDLFAGIDEDGRPLA